MMNDEKKYLKYLREDQYQNFVENHSKEYMNLLLTLLNISDYFQSSLPDVFRQKRPSSGQYYALNKFDWISISVPCEKQTCVFNFNTRTPGVWDVLWVSWESETPNSASSKDTKIKRMLDIGNASPYWNVPIDKQVATLLLENWPQIKTELAEKSASMAPEMEKALQSAIKAEERAKRDKEERERKKQEAEEHLNNLVAGFEL